MIADFPAFSDRPASEILQGGLDLLDQGLSIFDANDQLRVWNQAFLQLLDLPETLARCGTPLSAFIQHARECRDDGQPGIFAQLAAVDREQACIRDWQRPNGRVLLIHSEPLPHGGLVVLYRDITEQRYIENLTEHQNSELEERVRRRTAQLENANANLRRANAENERIAAALRRNEERLRLINDTMPILVGYVDKDERYQYANKGYADWYGHPVGEITGRAVREVVGEHVYAQVRESVRKALAGQQVSYEYQMVRDEHTVFARSTLVPERNPAGDILGFFVFAHDVTEQKRMQAALVQAQKMEAIGQLTGGLAHDFNNLLTVIIGNLAALRDQRPDDREVNDFIDPALQSARRGVQLIKRLLTFSRQQPLAPQAVDIELLVNGLATLIRRSLPESITLRTELAPAALHALVDPGQLESALLNFALNSRDAMPEGGELRIVTRAVTLADDAATFDVAPGMYALLEVIDNGSGMSAETQARIFEPFFTTKRFGLGSGLGLAMAYGFAKQSGGGIVVRSQPGQGTTVRMVLPLTTPEPETPSPSAALPGHQHDELVLLVEDEPNVRQVVRQQLMQLGHPVIEAENGEQAWTMIEQVSAIALVVSDIIMPGPLNGRQLAERIAQQAPHIHVVLMSGYADEDDELMSYPILAKPFLRQDLANALYQSRKDQE